MYKIMIATDLQFFGRREIINTKQSVFMVNKIAMNSNQTIGEIVVLSCPRFVPKNRPKIESEKIRRYQNGIDAGGSSI